MSSNAVLAMGFTGVEQVTVGKAHTENVTDFEDLGRSDDMSMDPRLEYER